ncbi:MAG: 3-hydroxyacyl-CoA dehydrogenase/enoyl-CoA hydratase family protein [Chloroherpetonaceae bacterium]|nr:3-hydroxyacyl-CoA dehydrogenase/enoyl-CoA hydratase family protein [Chthonomonadaceae bacterium]MDW8207536.1 3-hydroxyacyl-CoA dehydrogenase/enoyl-CoA hydratase family protein [Chloroherpetonaceae bacterium]
MKRLDGTCVRGLGVVVGAGTMGTGIAAQLANAGWEVLLLDLPGVAGQARNQYAIAGKERLLKRHPPLLFLPEYAGRIHPGNVEDDLQRMQEADWIVEAVVEDIAVKQEILAQIAAHCGEHTVVSSNTSGLSLTAMTGHCAPEFRRRFLGTHFLNPPRYLKLLEVIPLPDTDPNVTQGFIHFAERVLGHRVVMARDTPGFISTRIWIAHLMRTLHVAIATGMTVEQVDAVTGPLLGRPRSATFRMADLVGLDIIAAVARHQYQVLPDDALASRADLQVPPVMEALIARGYLGEKSGGGFYKKEGSTLLAVDLDTFSYRPVQRVQGPSLEQLMALPLRDRLRLLQRMVSGEVPVPDEDVRLLRFVWQILLSLIQYVTVHGPEIAGDVRAIDDVMRWGFGWEMGPFEMEDCLIRQEEGLAAGSRRNYMRDGKRQWIRVFGMEEMQEAVRPEEYLSLAEVREAGGVVMESPEARLLDIGEGVACLEFCTKMRTLNPALCDFIDVARERAERTFTALVIGGSGAPFSAGYDLSVLVSAIEAEQWERIEAMMQQVQNTFRRLKYSPIPIIAAVDGFTLGGGCECAWHCTAIQAAPELKMGLPEALAGVLPVGGGIKEILARALSAWDEHSDPFPRIAAAFERVAFPTSTTSAHEARQKGWLRERDRISRNADRLLYDARQRALELARAGYAPPEPERIYVCGATGLARLRMDIHERYRAGKITAYDRQIADRVARVFSGELPVAQRVCETSLLQLEREAFMALVRDPRALARMRHVLATGRPLRN